MPFMKLEGACNAIDEAGRYLSSCARGCVSEGRRGRALLAQAEPLEQDNHGNTPLHIAAAKGSLTCVAAVITGFNVNVLGNQNTIKFGKKKSGGGDASAAEKLTVVRDEKTKQMLAPLLNAQNDSGNTPMHIACEYGYIGVVDHLLMVRLHSRFATVTAFLHNREAKLFSTGRMPRIDGTAQAANCQVPWLKTLLMRCLHNNRAGTGKSALHDSFETDFGHFSPRQASADTSIKNNDGKCCFHLCAEIGHVKILEKLIVREVDTSIATDDGHTVVHYCAINNDAEVCNMQLQHFPQPNDQTDQARTRTDAALASRYKYLLYTLFEIRLRIR